MLQYTGQGACRPSAARLHAHGDAEHLMCGGVAEYDGVCYCVGVRFSCVGGSLSAEGQKLKVERRSYISERLSS